MTPVDIGTAAEAFWAWAWARHANELSWYIRPLFLVPLALFAYRRKAGRIVLTVVAMVTSMFWFPAPAVPDPKVLEFLAFEQEWLLGTWSLQKGAISVLVPLSLAAFCVAFWRRSLRWGLLLLAWIALAKIFWSVALSSGGAAVVVPATVGLVVGAALIAALVLRRRHSQP